MIKHYASPEQVQEIHEKVAKYPYGYLKKLVPFTHLSYTRLSVIVRSDKITWNAYRDIIEACKAYEKKYKIS
jgi:hypothetical protein